MKYDDEYVQEVLANSYKNFHAKGLDYVCLARTPLVTVKVYLLDGDATKVPEVVNPHDHRYRFRTEVLRGEMADFRYHRSRDRGPTYQLFDYRTPLNGGDGFTYVGDERLEQSTITRLYERETLESRPQHIHTISMRSDQCALLLHQYADEVPVDQPTRCWVRKGNPSPDTSGLYEKFTEDEIVARLRLIEELTR